MQSSLVSAVPRLHAQCGTPALTDMWALHGVVLVWLQDAPMDTDAVAGDDVGNVMWMRERWRELVGRMYGTEKAVPEGMDEVVEEIKQVQAVRAKSKQSSWIVFTQCSPLMLLKRKRWRLGWTAREAVARDALECGLSRLNHLAWVPQPAVS